MQPVDLFGTHHIRQDIKNVRLTDRMLHNHILKKQPDQKY